MQLTCYCFRPDLPKNKKTLFFRRFKMRKLFFLFIISYSALFAYSNDSQDEKLSELYTQYAYTSFRSGDFDDAVQLAETAVSFNSNNGDALYLQAILVKDLPGRISENYELLKRSIESGKWLYASKRDVFYEFGITGKRLSRFAETADLFGRLEDAELYTDAGMIRLYAEALYKTGKQKEARLILKESVRYFHTDGGLWGLLMEIDEKVFKELRSQLMLHDSDYLDDLYIPVIRRTEDPTFKRILIDKYYGKGLSSYEVMLESYLLFPMISWWQVRDILEERVPQTRHELELLIRIVQKNSLHSDFDRFWSNFSGTIENDLNDDGFSDTLEVYSRGNLEKLIMDVNQDGEPENILIVKENSYSLINRDEYLQEISYGRYPYINAVKTFSDNGDIIEYIFRPGQLKFEKILIPSDAYGEYRINKGSIYADKQMEMVLQVNTILSGKKSSDKSYLFYPYGVAEEDIFQGEKIVQKTYYSGGIPVKSEMDKDMDGIMECIIHYENGKPDTIMVDLNQNGFYDYSEKISADGIINEKMWDINEDGTFDISEKKDEKTLIRKFSTGLDGKYDIIMHILDGRISGIYKNSRKQQLERDRYGQYWIGKKKDIKFVEDSEGMVINGNNYYYIFNYNGIKYIEVLIE